MGFLENKKTPEHDKRFLFRQEYLTSLKYSLYHFTNNNNCFYHNFFYIEGAEGSGKTWILNQISLLCKDRNIAAGTLDIRLDSKNIILSEVLGIVNFLVQLRNVIVEKDPYSEQAFSHFDESYNNFLQGTLTDDLATDDKYSKEMQKTNALLLEREKEEKFREEKAMLLAEKEAQRLALLREQEANRAKSSGQASDAKSKLASLRSKSFTGKLTPTNSVPLVPGHVPKEKEVHDFSQNETRKPHIPEKRGTGPLNLAATAYTPLGNFGERELPRMKNGQADVKTIAKNLTNAVESLKKGNNLKPVDFKTILLRKFLQAFNNISTNRKVVLMIDSFEKLQPIYNFFFNGFLKNLRSEIILIISSQLDMEKELKQKYDTNLLYIYLQNFSYFEIDEYLKKSNLLSEPSLIETLLDLTGGSPAGIALISGAFQNFKGDIFKIMKFLGTPVEEDKNLRHINVITLDNLPQHDKKIIILLSLIRRVDYGLVENISGVFNAKNLLQSLSEKYSFIEESGLPEFVKRFTRTYAKYDMPSLYEEIHRNAFNYFTERVENEPKNKELLIDNFYYHFRINEEAAYMSLLSVISFYISTDIIFCEELIHGIASVGLSKEIRNRLNILKDSFPYVILKDYKKTLPLLEAISELQKVTPYSTSMQLLDGF